MVKLRNLIGSAKEIHFECMYTKHKTQKRKVWHDGFVSLYDSRRVVLYEDAPVTGTVLDDTKMSVYDWDKKDEDYISVPKFLIEIINFTPIDSASASGSAGDNAISSSGGYQSTSSVVDFDQPGSSLKTKPFSNPSFKTPASHGPIRLTRPTNKARYGANTHKDILDFASNPTSEWKYVRNAISRTPDEVTAFFS